jgi:hypothetical protein
MLVIAPSRQCRTVTRNAPSLSPTCKTSAGLWRGLTSLPGERGAISAPSSLYAQAIRNDVLKQWPLAGIISRDQAFASGLREGTPMYHVHDDYSRLHTGAHRKPATLVGVPALTQHVGLWIA